MNLYQNQKKLQIIVLAIGFFLVAMAIGILFTLNNKNHKPQPQAPNKIVPPQIAPEKLPQSVQELKKKLIANPIRNNNGDLLIYQSQNFYVEYITSPQVFFVKISKDADTSKKLASDWFIGQGAKAEDLCNLPVRFYLTTPAARQENPNFSSLAAGCSGQPLSKPTTTK